MLRRQESSEMDPFLPDLDPEPEPYKAGFSMAKLLPNKSRFEIPS
jgi:hypothetical protein